MICTILYGSLHGSTARYAHECARRCGIPAASGDDTPSHADTDCLVYFGALYAGGIRGLRDTLRRWKRSTSGNPDPRHLILVTVGLGDPALPENAARLQRDTERQIPPALRACSDVFHLRGAIDYAQLSWTHRNMMRLLYEKARRTPLAERDATQTMVETYGGVVDFVDFNRLAPIAARLAALRAGT